MFTKANGVKMVMGVAIIVISFYLITYLNNEFGACPGCKGNTMPDPSGGGSEDGSTSSEES